MARATAHLVEPELRARGNDVVPTNLPCDDDGAGRAEYADAVFDAVSAILRREH